MPCMTASDALPPSAFLSLLSMARERVIVNKSMIASVEMNEFARGGGSTITMADGRKLSVMESASEIQKQL